MNGIHVFHQSSHQYVSMKNEGDKKLCHDYELLNEIYLILIYFLSQTKCIPSRHSESVLETDCCFYTKKMTYPKILGILYKVYNQTILKYLNENGKSRTKLEISL